MVRAFWLSVAGMVLAAIAPPAFAQSRLFADDAPVAFTITAPFNTVLRTAKSSTDPVAATLTVAGDARAIPLQIAPRGFTRRTAGYCTFPPIKLDFERADVEGSLFEGQNKLKLVTHCKPAESFQQLYIKEYLVYRLYNLLTPISFRVRPAQVTYHDGEGRRADVTRFAFLVESQGDMARRNGLTPFETPPGQVAATRLDPPTITLLALFQYMIGNLDWDPVTGPPGDECCHNGKLLARDGATTGLIPVPYDFDFTGLVDAPYATPPDSIAVPNVRRRYYRGYCRDHDRLPAAIATLRQHRAAMASVIAGETLLADGERRAMQAYLDDFFKSVDNGDFERESTRHCRG